MMKKNVLLLIFISLMSLCTYAQTDSLKKQKNYVHLVGVQANGLFRQIFNFGNTNNPVNNPYLLTYSVFSPKKKWGADVGLGYTLNDAFTNDGNTKSENHINDLYARIGVQRVIPLNKRFVATAHLHGIVNLLNSETSSEENFNSQITKINSISSSQVFGGGPALSLRYRVANRIWLGTEMNYYFRFGNTKSTVTSTTLFQGQPVGNTTTQKIDNDFTNFTLNTPTALYLIMRF